MRAGTAFGGWKTRDAIPMLTDKMMKAKGRLFRDSLRDASAPTLSRSSLWPFLLRPGLTRLSRRAAL